MPVRRASYLIEVTARTIQLQRLQRLFTRLGSTTQAVSNRLRAIPNLLRRMGSGVRSLAGQVFNLRNSFAFLIGGAITGSLVRITDNMVGLTFRLRQATRGQEEFNVAYATLQDIAIQTGGSFAASVAVLQRISFVRDDLNLTNDAALQFVRTVQQLGAISGASPDALRAGLLQLGQALSSGIVRAEEFNSLLENLPALVNELAQAAGISAGQLRLLVNEGLITSNDVLTLLLSRTQQVQEQFEELPLTVGTAIASIRTAFESWLNSFNEATNANERLANNIQAFGLFAVRSLDRVVGVFQALGSVISITANAVQFIGAQFAIVYEQVRLATNAIATFFRTGSVDSVRDLTRGENLVLRQARENVADFYSAPIRQSIEDFAAGAQRAVEPFMSIQDTTDNIAGNVEIAEDDLNSIVQRIQRDAGNLRGAANQNDPAREASTRARVERVRTDFERLIPVVREFRNDIRDAFTDFTRGAISAREASQRFADAILDLANQRFVIQPLLRIFDNFLANSGNSIFGNFFGTSTAPSFLNPSIQGPPRPPGFNQGGSITVGGRGGIDNNLLSLNNRPIARVSRGETIDIDNNGGDGRVTVNQNFNLTMGVTTEVRRELANFLPTIRQQTLAAVRDAEVRNIQ